MDNEIKDINIDNAGYICPEKTNKVALIDADTIIYAACSMKQIVEELLPRDMYTDNEWEMTTNSQDPNYPIEYLEKLDIIRAIYLDKAYEHAIDKINSILDRTGCIDFELHFTRGRESFPYTQVTDTYKACRVTEHEKGSIEWYQDYIKVPFGINQLKDLFVEKHHEKCYNNYMCEADHIVACKKRDFPDKYILCAVDKDVLYSLEGRHFNYYQSTKYSIDMKWVDVTKEEAMKRYYIQTLTGDTGDGVIGLKGIGPKKAEKALQGCKNPKECWEVVVSMYEKNNRDIVDALINMRLVNMLQMRLKNYNKNYREVNEVDYDVVLWRPSLTEEYQEEVYKDGR